MRARSQAKCKEIKQNEDERSPSVYLGRIVCLVI